MIRVFLKIKPVFLLLWIFTIVATGQDIYPDPALLVFSRLTQNEGLSNSNVECIIKDTDGFLWFGTRNGLCRFDGFEIKTFYTSATENSISGNRILCINEDKQGNLWIGTYNNGLNRYDKTTGRFYHYGSGYNIADRINNIEVLLDSSVWICSNYGLAMYLPESDQFRVYLNDPDNPHSINSPVVYDMCETRSGDLFVATESYYIQQFNRTTETFTTVEYKRDQELNTNYRKKILEDNNGILWIAANVHGLCSYDPESGESEIFSKGENGLLTNILTGSMALDPDGNIWICTDGEGINIYDPDKREFRYLSTDNTPGSLSSKHIYSVYFDNQNIIWVGTFDEGVNYFDPGRIKFHSTFVSPNDLKFFQNKSVISLFQDSRGQIWAGTDGDGLFRIQEDGSITEFHYNPSDENSLSTEVITSINEDHLGNILIGTYSGGFIVYSPSNNRFQRYFQGNTNKHPGSNNIWSIYRDSRDRIWLGLLGAGLDRFNPEFRTFEHLGPNAESQLKVDFPNVMTITEDSDGDIWYGTEGRGVYILDRETNKILQIAPDSVHNITTQGIIKCIFQDKWENIWIGTEGMGLYKYNKTNHELAQIDQQNGLPDNIIQSIAEDAAGNLWLGTSKGLAMYNPNTEKINTYLESDGLSGNIFNQNCLISLADGHLMAGTTQGLDFFNPLQITTNQNLPKLVLTTLKIFNQEIHAGAIINGRVILDKNISYTNSITLTNKDKAFSIDFVALNYTLPEKCMFAFRLEGFDPDWTYVGSDRRTANYSNLPAGRYTFRVKASNNDGKWGNNERTLHIRVLPPFYQTWWFKSVFILLLTTLAFAIYRYQLNVYKSRFQTKQLEQEKRIIELENEKLETELKNLTFHVLNRNRALIDQKNRLMGLSMKAKESVRKGLQDIISGFDEELNDDKDWKYIEPQLDKVYNNFVSRLKELHPDLTVTEIKIAAYVRMNLSTKEICEFMHKTPRAIENDRYRLRKKIHLDSNDSLQNYLMNL